MQDKLDRKLMRGLAALRPKSYSNLIHNTHQERKKQKARKNVLSNKNLNLQFTKLFESNLA